MKKTIGSSAVTLAVAMSLLGRHDAPMAAGRENTQLSTSVGAEPRWLDATRRDAARAAAAQNPAGFPLRDHTNQVATQLGFGADDRFELIRAHVDEDGYTHAVLQQTRQGVPVFGGRLIAHRNPRGAYDPFTDAGIRDIRTSSRPSVASESAIAMVNGHESHAHPFVTAPSASLFFYPEYQRTLASGAPLPPTHYNHAALHSMVESINSDDVVKTLVATRLAWRVVGVEHDAATNAYRPAFWWVDAHSGAILSTGDLSHSAGSGAGFVHTAVSLGTSDDGSCHVMEDETREFRTETEDFSSDEPVNCDSNDDWGNGLAFVGEANSPSTANWQTAMVDGHFAATVYWDMMDNVFNYQGPDDDYYSVNLFMHHGTDHNNAHYFGVSGNVVFGDGPDGVKYTRTDVIGHELGHAWDDHNSQFDGSSQLNESIADIFGEWTEVYLQSGFANSSVSLGAYSDNPSNWVHSTGRDLANPNASGHPAYWSTLLDNLDVHDASLPASRAFTFLANGSSPWVDAPNYSRRMAWGMYGVGLPVAAKIFMKAHSSFLLSGEYENLRDSMGAAAVFQSLSAFESTINAYAAINVGAPSPSAPLPPPATPETMLPNSTIGQAQPLGNGMLPPTGAVASAPRKIKVTGGGNDRDYYSVRLSGNKIAVLLTPIFTGSLADYKPYALAILDGNTPAGILKLATESIDPQVLTVTFPTVSTRSLRIVVMSFSGTPSSKYELDIDLGTVP